jgi:peptidoglycan/xylan/chitin deacetylase (PgdA/CDA1 family)
MLVAAGGVVASAAAGVLVGTSGPGGTRLTAAKEPHPAKEPRVRPSPERPAAKRHTSPARKVTPHHAEQQAEPMYYIHDGAKSIALTIDDGPSPVYTPQILRLLDKYKITASFSMIGRNATEYPEIAREVARAGHMIVNHTWDHANLAPLDEAHVADEIDRATDAIHRATGETPRIFRAPYGAWSRTVLDYCGRYGLAALDWSIDPRDWARPGTDEIVDNILDNTQTGSIILEHDGGGDRSETVAALRIVIPRLLDEGYHFRTP